MKIQINKAARTNGNVLVVTLLIAVIIGVTLGSYLTLVDQRSRSVARSQIWNGTMSVTESGIEDGLALLNKFSGSPNVTNWAGTCTSDGWANLGGNVYHLTRYMDAAHTTYYEVYITNANNAPILRSTGYVPGPAWLSGGQMSRTVIFQTKIDALFNVCMASLGAIDLKGNGIASDSFDSSDPSYPGYWTNTIRKAGGDIVTNNTLTNSVLSVGNANIAGHVTTGPNGSITIGPNGSVGSLAWVDAPTYGIEPGWSGNDLNVVFKDIILPAVSWLNAGGVGTGGSGVAPDGKTYGHVFTVPGDQYYRVTDSQTIYVGTNVQLRLNITTPNFNPNEIFVAGAGAYAGSMIGYLNGPPGQSCTLGTEDRTESGLAKNLAFLGLPNCTSVSYKGNGDFTGVIYANHADFQLAGGGSGIIDFIGSSVTLTVQMNGHYHFHYDESLKKAIFDTGYVGINWREL
jgi:hypothetical protein